MTGLPALIDTLLAAHHSARLDLLALKGQAQIKAPGPVPQVPRLENELQLPSDAALDRLLPAGPSVAAQPARGQRPAGAELSSTARLIGAVLAQHRGDAGPVRAAVPVMPSPQAVPSAVLALALQRSVSNSGLFYESHLAQWIHGIRTLGQMTQEPQAEDPVAVRHAIGAGESELSAPSAQVIHPQALTLVQQQLDLLASTEFRWTGQAWPGVPMDWSIKEEEIDRDAHASREEAAQRRWSTTLSLTLPRLGEVAVRLGLAGSNLSARLAASEAATVARLRADGATLAGRLEGAGLRLQEMQLTAMEQA